MREVRKGEGDSQIPPMVKVKKRTKGFQKDRGLSLGFPDDSVESVFRVTLKGLSYSFNEKTFVEKKGIRRVDCGKLFAL